MREWYEKGYIYKDFASRVNDMFFMPNTALTYGGNTGVWYGFVGQLGDKMSKPEYGLFFDMRPIPSPLSTADGITEVPNIQRNLYEGGVSYAFTTACKNIPKLLSIFDYFYSKEGIELRNGLTKETGAAENPIYIAAGLQDGLYWYEDGKRVKNPVVDTVKDGNAFYGNRLPGVTRPVNPNPDSIAAQPVWDPYPNAKLTKLPGLGGGGASRTVEEDKVYAPNNVAITDYLNSTIPKFIMGTQPLNDQAWAEFKATLRSLGAEENLRIQQAAYERWLKR
jgi:hypothetical protein